MCSCACGYANGYVNRMLQHVRHKFCWKAVVVRATNRPFAVTFQLAPIKLSLNRPHSHFSSFLATLQLEDHGADPKADAISLTHPHTQWRHWLPAAQINYEGSVLSGPLKWQTFPCNFHFGNSETGNGESKAATGGGIFPLYLRCTVSAKNPLQAPNTGKDPRRDEPGHRQTNTLT